MFYINSMTMYTSIQDNYLTIQLELIVYTSCITNLYKNMS